MMVMKRQRGHTDMRTEIPMYGSPMDIRRAPTTKSHKVDIILFLAILMSHGDSCSFFLGSFISLATILLQSSLQKLMRVPERAQIKPKLTPTMISKICTMLPPYNTYTI